MSTFQPGDLVTHETRAQRTNAAPVMTRTISRVIAEDSGLVIFRPVGVFCYVYGYPEKGRRLPCGEAFAAAVDEVSLVFGGVV